MLAYTTFGFEGATATATRPQGFSGRPLLLVSFRSVQCSPPSVETYNPLPGPPERNVQPCLRKSQREAKIVLGASGLMAIRPQPVEPFGPARTFLHVLPPSEERRVGKECRSRWSRYQLKTRE